MTLILELSPEAEARLRHEAGEHGISLEEWALERLSDSAARQERRRILARLRGAGANRGWTSQDFLRERHEEALRDATKSEGGHVP